MGECVQRAESVILQRSGAMVTGWLTNSKGQRRYFDPSTGYMKTKWLKLGNKTYYLYSKSGIAATGL